MKKIILLLCLSLLNTKNIICSNLVSQTGIQTMTSTKGGLSPEQEMQLLSYKRYETLLTDLVKKRVPSEYRAIQIICLLLPHFACLKIITTNQNENESILFATEKMPWINPTQGTLTTTVFGHLQARTVMFKKSDMNAYSLGELSKAIALHSALNAQETQDFAHIALGERPGEIIFEQPDKLTIKPCK